MIRPLAERRELPGPAEQEPLCYRSKPTLELLRQRPRPQVSLFLANTARFYIKGVLSKHLNQLLTKRTAGLEK